MTNKKTKMDDICRSSAQMINHRVFLNDAKKMKSDEN